jgi:hypothetical protein
MGLSEIGVRTLLLTAEPRQIIQSATNEYEHKIRYQALASAAETTTRKRHCFA